MQVGMIGAGRMGANLVRRLLLDGHDCVVYDVDDEAVEKLAAEGAVGTHTIAEFTAALETPRVAWIMVPAAHTQATIAELAPYFQPADIMIDGGNSMWQDDVDTAVTLAKQGINFVDVGTSGGVWGLERGYSLMIGGEADVVSYLEPVFDTIAPGFEAAPRTRGQQGPPGAGEKGWLHCGPNGAGHFVKMVHNGIEYGMMAAIAEGLGILEAANAGTVDREADAETTPMRNGRYYRYDIDTAAVAEVWRRGSVISSWLGDLTAHALSVDPNLEAFSGRVSDSGEGRWTAQAAVELGVPANTITASLYARFASQGNDLFPNRVLSALRAEFGGHVEKAVEGAAKTSLILILVLILVLVLVLVLADVLVDGAVVERVVVERGRLDRRLSRHRPPIERLMGPPVHPEADTLILFGASGDLARKKLLPALYELTRAGRLEIPVVGVADTDWFNQDFAQRARESVVEYVDENEHLTLDTEALERLCDRLVFISGDYGDDATWRQLASATEDTKLAVAFLAVPPGLVGPVVKGLDTIYLAPRARVVVEKPFGRDLASAKELNHTLHDYLDESQLYRIDHFLGKEPVQNLMVFRFANSLLESVWNRNHVESVTVTMAESFGVEGRGHFYDGVGCIRDVVQNHLLQMVALLTMEPPASKNQHALLDEKVKVFRAMRPLDPSNVVRGQVEGYRGEDGVDPESDTETFAAMKLEIDSWRWSGVPFYIRAGKSLAKTVTEAVVEFKQPPRMLFSEEDHLPDPCRLRFRMKPDDSITLSMQSKVPGMEMVSQSVDMTVDYDAPTGHVPDAYERLIGDALIGDQRLFTRQDGVEETWRVIDPILHDMEPTKLYRAGSWGPDEAKRFVPAGCGDV